MKEPKDLGVKIGTKKEKFLRDILEKLEEEKENCERTAEIDEAFIKVLKMMISKEIP